MTVPSHIVLVSIVGLHLIKLGLCLVETVLESVDLSKAMNDVNFSVHFVYLFGQRTTFLVRFVCLVEAIKGTFHIPEVPQCNRLTFTLAQLLEKAEGFFEAVIRSVVAV